MHLITELPLVDHLILLVGTNPVPNAVAGLSLLNQGGTITLLHSSESSGTGQIAARLQTWFEKQKIFCVMVETHEADPDQIFKKVWDSFANAKSLRQSKHLLPFTTIGLNYTGATKMMAVHARDAVILWGARNDTTPVCSYLDARSLKMVIDPQRSFEDPAGGTKAACKYIGDVVIKLDDLLLLHKWNNGPYREEPLLPKSAHLLAELYKRQLRSNPWVEWKMKALYPVCQEGNRLKEIAALNQVNLSVPPDTINREANKILTSVSEELGLGTGNVINMEKATTLGTFQDSGEFYKWLDGGWLETVTFKAVQKCKAACDLHTLYTNFRPIDPDRRTGRRGENFNPELDVVAMRGHQLFVFSCGTSIGRKSHHELKMKLFEVTERARQLGGDEARVALVCCDPDIDTLKEELHSSVDLLGQIEVFGQNDLTNLSTRFSQWILKQAGKV